MRTTYKDVLRQLKNDEEYYAKYGRDRGYYYRPDLVRLEHNGIGFVVSWPKYREDKANEPPLQWASLYPGNLWVFKMPENSREVDDYMFKRMKWVSTPFSIRKRDGKFIMVHSYHQYDMGDPQYAWQMRDNIWEYRYSMTAKPKWNVTKNRWGNTYRSMANVAVEGAPLLIDSDPKLYTKLFRITQCRDAEIFMKIMDATREDKVGKRALARNFRYKLRESIDGNDRY